MTAIAVMGFLAGFLWARWIERQLTDRGKLVVTVAILGIVLGLLLMEASA